MLLWLSHPDDPLLERYAAGEIEDERVAGLLREHIEDCVQCQAEIRRVRRAQRASDEQSKAPQCGPARRSRAAGGK